MKTEIIPVIHMTSERQVLANIDTCLDCGIKKVFLINHAVSVGDLIKCIYTVKQYEPTLWVGLNMLGTKPGHALKIRYGKPYNFKAELVVDGLWCDETIIPQDRFYGLGFKGMLFGGVAFKYQPQPKDLKLACEEAKRLTDVATTSGSGTGKSADVDKIKQIREYLGEHPMAIASGISVDNIDNYKDIANYILVASSITDINEMIIEEKLMELKSKI